MQRVTEELYFDDGTRGIRLHPAVRRGCVVEAGRRYSFELCRKPAQFGPISINNQYWMDTSTVYGGAGRAGRNHGCIVEYFKAQCVRTLSIFDDDVLDSYVLANLLPHMRRNGSRRIFDDAIVTTGPRYGKRAQSLVRELDAKLAASRCEMLDMTTFHHQTNRLLGKPDLPPSADAAYQELAEELLGEGRRSVGRWGTDGLQVPIQKMQNWMSTFVRRRGNEEKKLALDMLTYEARAAVHRCYSAVWFELLQHLDKKYAFDSASYDYHRLMHCEFICPSDTPNANFHLFHGHVFALHPGLSLFFQTVTGGELIADFLQVNDQGRPFQRLLHGFWIALLDYSTRSDECKLSRKKIGRQLADDDLGDVDARQTRGRGTRRLRGPRSEDGARR